MDIRDWFLELILIIFLLNTHPGLSLFEDVEYYEPSFNRCPSIHNKLKNGRVRYIDKGRIAKFLCDRRFELVGKTSSTCLRGQWNNPVPVCVARGCNRVRSLSNGRVTAMYRGAILVFVCNPGYALEGSPTIHCEGRQWNTAPPLCIWNSSKIQSTDESTPKDYSPSYSVTSQSMLYTNLQNSGETFDSTTDLQTEKLNSMMDPFLNSSSSLTPTSTSLKTDDFTAKPIPFQTLPITKKTLSTDIKSSTVFKTDISTSSASIKTTHYVSKNSPISTNRTTLATTSLETDDTSMTPRSISTTLRTTTTAAKQKTTPYITQRTSQARNTKISTLSTTLETATQSVFVSVSVDNTITTDDNVSSFATDSSSAADTSNTELISGPRIMLTSIRNTFNLRPRKSSTTTYTTTPVLNTTKGSLIIHSKENTSVYIFMTPRYLPNLTASTKKQTLRRLTTRNSLPDEFTGIHTSTELSQTRVEHLPQTTKFSNSFSKPTKNTLQKTSDLNGKIIPSKSTVKGIVAIVIIALILIIAGFAYYIRKRRRNRQSKLSDVSDMRFLSKCDYIEGSNYASLNGILIE